MFPLKFKEKSKRYVFYLLSHQTLDLYEVLTDLWKGETLIKYESLISTVEVFKLDQVCKLKYLYSSSLLFEVSKFSKYTCWTIQILYKYEGKISSI